jgi:hypothetical protein
MHFSGFNNRQDTKISPPVAIAPFGNYPYPFPDMTAKVTPDEEVFTL